MASTLSLDEAAQLLKTSADTVSECIRFRGLPAAKIGRAWVLVDDDVIGWLRQQYGPQEDASRESLTVPMPPHASALALREALAPRPKASRRGAAKR